MQVPRPLAIGRVVLESEEECLGFIAEGWIAEDPECTDITQYGGWLSYKNRDTSKSENA